jgi:hypothetical protein
VDMSSGVSRPCSFLRRIIQLLIVSLEEDG